MKKHLLATFLLAACLFCGCKNETKNETEASEDVSVAPIATPDPSQRTQPLSTEPSQAQPQQSTAANPNEGLKGNNPEHGKPGHRCDISVGAPLSSPPGKTGANTVNTTVPAPTSNPVSSGNLASPVSNQPVTIDPSQMKQIQNPTPTAPGVNPPHGQPGHDCAIAVGAPLKK